MPRISSWTSKKLIAPLIQHGFVVDHITGSHYILYREVGRTRVTVPYHGKDIPKGTLFSIIKASGVPISFFRK